MQVIVTSHDTINVEDSTADDLTLNGNRSHCINRLKDHGVHYVSETRWPID